MQRRLSIPNCVLGGTYLFSMSHSLVCLSPNDGESAKMIAEDDNRRPLFDHNPSMDEQPQLQTNWFAPETDDWLLAPYFWTGLVHPHGALEGGWVPVPAISPDGYSSPHCQLPPDLYRIGSWTESNYHFGFEASLSYYYIHPDLMASQSREGIPAEPAHNTSPPRFVNVDAVVSPPTPNRILEHRTLSGQSQFSMIQETEISEYDRCMAEYGLQGLPYANILPRPPPPQDSQSKSSTTRYTPSETSSSSINSPSGSPHTCCSDLKMYYEDPSKPK